MWILFAKPSADTKDGSRATSSHFVYFRSVNKVFFIWLPRCHYLQKFIQLKDIYSTPYISHNIIYYQERSYLGDIYYTFNVFIYGNQSYSVRIIDSICMINMYVIHDKSVCIFMPGGTPSVCCLNVIRRCVTLATLGFI